MFSKTMSISDELMWSWYELLSLRSNEEIEGLKRQAREGRNPRDIKVLLAKEIVARFHSEQAAEMAAFEFMARFKAGAIPNDMPDVTVTGGDGEIPIATLLKQAGLTSSTSEAVRSIEQGWSEDRRRESQRSCVDRQARDLRGADRQAQMGARDCRIATLQCAAGAAATRATPNACGAT